MANEITGVKISAMPAASNLSGTDVLAGVRSGNNKKFSLSVLLAWLKTQIAPADIGAVPTSRTINGNALTGNITLDAEDVGAASTGDLANVAALAGAIAADLATVEATSTASTNYAVGEHLVLSGVLYEVTAAISSGETITPGTNVTAVTVTEITDDLDGRVDALETALDGLVSRLGAI